MNWITPTKNQDLSKGITIWLAKLNEFFPKLGSLRELLNSKELAKADRFHFEIHQKRYAISQALLRSLLEKYTNIAAREIEFLTHEHGKPFLKNNPVFFNVSHSNDYALFAFDFNHPLGIDLEYWRERKFFDGIIDSNFSKLEQDIYHQLSDDLKVASFYQGWTCNEAFIKAVGLGLSYPLDSFSVEMDPRKDAKLLEATPYEDFDIDWQLFKLPCPNNYSAALAAKNCHHISLYRLDYDILL